MTISISDISVLFCYWLLLSSNNYFTIHQGMHKNLICASHFFSIKTHFRSKIQYDLLLLSAKTTSMYCKHWHNMSPWVLVVSPYLFVLEIKWRLTTKQFVMMQIMPIGPKSERSDSHCAQRKLICSAMNVETASQCQTQCVVARGKKIHTHTKKTPFGLEVCEGFGDNLLCLTFGGVL